MEILKEPLLAFISLFLSTLVGWLFGRRKQQAETQTTELDNVDKAIHIYRQMIDDLSQKYAQAITELHTAQQRIKELETTIENLLSQINATQKSTPRYLSNHPLTFRTADRGKR